jgi:hypothetical protein
MYHNRVAANTLYFVKYSGLTPGEAPAQSSIDRRSQIVRRLPKPIYEGIPFFLIGVGILFLSLVLNRYEYAPTLSIWLLGMFCIVAGAFMIGIRLLVRLNKPRED